MVSHPDQWSGWDAMIRVTLSHLPCVMAASGASVFFTPSLIMCSCIDAQPNEAAAAAAAAVRGGGGGGGAL